MSHARDLRWLDSSLVLAVGVVCYTAVFSKTAVWQTIVGADLIKNVVLT